MIAMMIVVSNDLVAGSARSPGSDDAAPTVGTSPGAVVVAVAGVGEGATAPQVGISPASVETERMHVKATVNMNRFIGITPCLRKNHVHMFTSPKIRPMPQHFLQGRAERTNIAFAIAQLASL